MPAKADAAAEPNLPRLRETLLGEIAARGVLKRYPARTVLIHEGDGSSREMVSRVMKELAAGGHIAVRERRIFICKKPPAAW